MEDTPDLILDRKYCSHIGLSSAFIGNSTSINNNEPSTSSVTNQSSSSTPSLSSSSSSPSISAPVSLSAPSPHAAPTVTEEDNPLECEPSSLTSFGNEIGGGDTALTSDSSLVVDLNEAVSFTLVQKSKKRSKKVLRVCCICPAGRTKTNLLKCMALDCGIILCGAAGDNHAEEHYQENPDHVMVIQLHVSRKRIWCSECNFEVFRIRVSEVLRDFDFGLGGKRNEVVRVSEVLPDVTKSEVSLILWLLIEQEFKGVSGLAEKEVQVDRDPDSPDAASRVQYDSGDSLLQPTVTSQAKRYSEELLRAVGVSIPFELLSSNQRQELFNLFTSSSNLLLGQKFRSILDLYEKLRQRSKFREEFETETMIGEGEFGNVCSVRLRSEQTESQRHTEFALKRMRIKSFDALDDVRMIVNESVILKKLNGHPNIVGYYNSWLEMDETESDNLVFYLQMELCGITLSQWKEMFPKKRLPEETLLRITTELIDALEWIHASSCIHLDINPKNILWANEHENSVKITDFGLAVIGGSYHGRVGTVPYIPPENILNSKSDVYSLGVTLFEVSQNFSTRTELMKKIESKNFFTEVSFLDDLLPHMLRKQQALRLTAAELKTKLNSGP